MSHSISEDTSDDFFLIRPQQAGKYHCSLFLGGGNGGKDYITNPTFEGSL